MSTEATIVPVDPVYFYWNNYYSGDGHTMWPPPGQLIYHAGYNSRDEQIVSDDDKRRKGFKDCQHWKFTVTQPNTSQAINTWYSTNHALGTWIRNPPEPTTWIWTGDPNYGYPSTTFGGSADPTKDLVPLLCIGPDGARAVAPPPDLCALVAASLRAMLPGIRPRLSLPNSILELKDFKSLPHTFDRIRNAASFLQPYGRKPLAKLVKRAKRSTGAVSDSYLQYQFNLAPLVSDLCGLFHTLTSVRQELALLVHNANRRQIRHFRRKMADRYPDTYDQRQNRVANQTWVCGTNLLYSRRVSYSIRDFNATLEYSYKLPSLSNELMLVGAVLDSLGVNLNPSIVWNAIPWSFVVDWFLSVNSFLSNYKVRWIEPVTVLHQYCWSINVRREISIACGVDVLLPVNSHDQEVYLRSVTMPADWRSLLSSSGINLKEFMLASALAGSRLH